MRFVTVEGRRVHLIEEGTVRAGEPTVVLESGVGGWSLAWHLVQREVAKFAHVVSFDRPGYGYSEPLPDGASWDAAHAAERLYLSLLAAGCAPPWVLVGHSFAGFILRELVRRRRQDVAGLVFVDVDHEAEWSPRFPPEHQKGLRLITRAAGLMAASAAVGLPQLFGAVGLLKAGGLAHLPEDIRREVLARAFRADALRAAHRELEALEPSAVQVRTAGDLDALPTVVIRHGRPGPVAPGTSAQTAAEIEQRFAQVQEELARLSTRGKVICAANSGHDVQLESPEMVVEAVREVLSAATATPPSR